MAYEKHVFNSGDILYASQLNAMNDQIKANEVFNGENPITTRIMAHRGTTKDGMPLACIGSYEHACQLNFYGLNITVPRLSLNGTFWVSHDFDLKDSTDIETIKPSLEAYPINKFTDAELNNVHITYTHTAELTDDQLKLPTLDQLLKLCALYGKVPLIGMDTSNYISNAHLPITKNDIPIDENGNTKASDVIWQELFDRIAYYGLDKCVMWRGQPHVMNFIDQYYPNNRKIIYYGNFVYQNEDSTKPSSVDYLIENFNKYTWHDKSTLYYLNGTIAAYRSQSKKFTDAGYGGFLLARLVDTTNYNITPALYRSIFSNPSVKYANGERWDSVSEFINGDGGPG